MKNLICVCFLILSTNIFNPVDENMLHHSVYLATNEKPTEFKLYSDNGIVTCVWEVAVLWFELNAWVEYVFQKESNPDLDGYLSAQLNTDV